MCFWARNIALSLNDSTKITFDFEEINMMFGSSINHPWFGCPDCITSTIYNQKKPHEFWLFLVWKRKVGKVLIKSLRNFIMKYISSQSEIGAQPLVGFLASENCINHNFWGLIGPWILQLLWNLNTCGQLQIVVEVDEPTYYYYSRLCD